MPSPNEIYEVEISREDGAGIFVAVTDLASGRRLTGFTKSSATQIVGVLIEDHRERNQTDAVDPALAEQKRKRREVIISDATAVFGDENIARAWLGKPHFDFENRRPLAVAACDEEGLAAVRSALEALDRRSRGC